MKIMFDEKIAKQLVNYIYKYKLSDNFIVVPFDNILLDEKNESNCKLLIDKYENVDKIIEILRKEFRIVNLKIHRKIENLPVSLTKMGRILETNSSGISYFFGREYELKKINVIRNKRVKNNVLIVGRPGTGKTSLVEAYAKRYNIKNIFVVECAKLIANTEYRGAFEQKIVELMNFAKTMNIILFFDEIHVLLDLGKSQGGISITDILKPYLLDENLCFIGSTTIKEVELLLADEAFKRRFTTIHLNEPSDEQLISMKCLFEKNITKEVILDTDDSLYVIKNLREKLTTQYFPDKFIDFLDYLFSFKTIIDKNMCYKKILKEYIDDQKFEISNS